MRGILVVLVFSAGVMFALGCAKTRADSVQRPTAARQKGAQLYANMCAICHGRDGEGYTADQATALANADFLASASDAFLRTAIEAGRAGTTMSAWGAELGGPLTDEDIGALITFMRGWDPRPQESLDERAAGGSAERGEAAYTSRCAGCHGVGGKDGSFTRLGSPHFLQSASNGYIRSAMRNGRRNTPMPSFTATLGDKGIEDVLAHMRRWPSWLKPPADFGPLPAPLPLGPLPLNPQGPEPSGFLPYPLMTSLAVVKQQFDLRAKMAFLDARPASDYAEMHIAGAVSVPFYDPAPYLTGLPKDAWLVCYCACPHAQSAALAQKLLAAGFTKVTVLDEGFFEWRDGKHPTRPGLSP